MKRLLCVGVLGILLVVSVQNAYGVQRVVLAEEFTGTWCPYCPGAARGLDSLAQIARDTLAVIAYHIGDAFTVPEANIRDSYYNIPGYPTVRFDGVYAVVGGSYNGTMFPQYYNYYNFLKTIDQPIAFTLDGMYEYNLREGTIHIQLENTGTEAITANLRTAIVLTDTPYTWQNMTELEWVLRDMIPNAYGVPVSLDAGATWDTSLAFSIPANVSDNKIQFVVFVQGDPTRVVYGAAKVDLVDFSWVEVAEESGPHMPTGVEVRRRGPRGFEIRNPGLEEHTIQVEIWNALGRRTFGTRIRPGDQTTVTLPPGVYFYRARISGQVISQGKLVSLP